jgi:hypothetical protein
MKAVRLFFGIAFLSAIGTTQTLQCNFEGYRPMAGVNAAMNRGTLEITWRGEGLEQLGAQFRIQDGHPLVQQLSARNGGIWSILAKDLTPEFQVTTGRRRISSTQRNLLKKFGIDTPAEEDARKWNTFWDAPLAVPGGHDTTDLPRSADEIRRASVGYRSQHCYVTSNGTRVTVTFDGLTLGLFSGDVAFTAYKGSNLLRQEAIAKTD